MFLSAILYIFISSSAILVHAFRKSRIPLTISNALVGNAIRRYGISSSGDVVCIGEVLFDCIYDSEPIEGGGQIESYPGGAPANVACALTKLGIYSRFLGSVGNDVEGLQLLELLNKIGVNSQLCQILEAQNYPTRKVMVARKVNGDRQFAGFWKNASTVSFADVYYSLPSQSWDQLNQLLKESVSAVVVGTLGLAHESPTKDFMGKLRGSLQSLPVESKPLFVVDINWRPVFWNVDNESEQQIARDRIRNFVSNCADIVKLTDDEAAWLLGNLGLDAETALESPHKVYDLLKPRLGVLVSAGEFGAACYFPPVGSVRLPALSVNVQETTGAGDAFLAGFLYKVLKNKETLETIEGLREGLLFASAAGALTCTKKGAIAAQPTLHEIEAVLANIK